MVEIANKLESFYNQVSAVCVIFFQTFKSCNLERMTSSGTKHSITLVIFYILIVRLVRTD